MIVETKWLRDALEHARKKNSIVLTCGCFDVLTYGHVKHLERASMMGDILVVNLTPDRWISKPGRPIFSQQKRGIVVSALHFVDYVVINEDWPNAVEAIKQFRPNLYVKGREYRKNPTPQLEAEKQALLAINGELVFTDTEEFHTSEVLEKLANVR